jgi:ferredoxin-NADP reductase
MGLIAGGTGVTPMYSLALSSLLANDGLQIRFLCTNKTKNDILCKKELD